jgi:hypothetical protein
VNDFFLVLKVYLQREVQKKKEKYFDDIKMSLNTGLSSQYSL